MNDYKNIRKEVIEKIINFPVLMMMIMMIMMMMMTFQDQILIFKYELGQLPTTQGLQRGLKKAPISMF